LTTISEVLPAFIIALMVEAVSTSETLVKFYNTKWHNIPEDSHLHTCHPDHLNFHSCSPAKKQKCSLEGRSGRHFQEWWTEIYGMINKGNKLLCVLCSESVVCRTSSATRYYETSHEWLHKKKKEV
jgi:hypothetical protein